MKNFDLRDLDAFVAVARTRNFRRAATEQGVSVSSLSQRLRDMEERLGVRLMNRTTRSVRSPKPANCCWPVSGLRYRMSARRSIRCADCAPCRRDVCASMRRRRRSIWCWRRWSRRFLQPIRRSISRSSARASFVDIVAGGFDAGVRYGEHLAQDMIAVSLGAPQRYAVVASREYVAQHGSPKHPKDLLEHSCIRTRFGSGAMLDWEFEKAGRVVKVSPPAKLSRDLSRPGVARRP